MAYYALALGFAPKGAAAATDETTPCELGMFHFTNYRVTRRTSVLLFPSSQGFHKSPRTLERTIAGILVDENKHALGTSTPIRFHEAPTAPEKRKIHASKLSPFIACV